MNAPSSRPDNEPTRSGASSVASELERILVDLHGLEMRLIRRHLAVEARVSADDVTPEIHVVCSGRFWKEPPGGFDLDELAAQIAPVIFGLAAATGRRMVVESLFPTSEGTYHFFPVDLHGAARWVCEGHICGRLQPATESEFADLVFREAQPTASAWMWQMEDLAGPKDLQPGDEALIVRKRPHGQWSFGVVRRTG